MCSGRHHAVLCYKNVKKASIPRKDNATQSHTTITTAPANHTQAKASGATLMTRAPKPRYTALPIIEAMVQGPGK